MPTIELRAEDCMSPIAWHMRKHNFKVSDLARSIRCHPVTMSKYIKDPFQMTLQDVSTICGLFGVNVVEMVYLISKYKPEIKKKDRKIIHSFLKDVEI